jgi:hypothetical protein
MNSVGTSSTINTVIPYTLPNLILTSSKVKRNGQTTGKATMTLKGTFFNGLVGNRQNSITLKFAYWSVNSEESTTYYEIPTSAYVIDGNNISMENWNVAKNGDEITDLNKENAYKFRIIATDNFEKTSTIELTCMSGEYLMAKYKDRVDFKAITIGGKPIHEQKILWEGSSYMNATQTAKLSELVSKQKNGIVLVWSQYSNGALDARWNYTFVPKMHVEISGGGGVSCIMGGAGFAAVGNKYVYIEDEQITGYASNNTTGTTNGITWTNNAFVLRYVIGI